MGKNIGIVNVDGLHYPNYALMKISAYHKQHGDHVEFADPMFGEYDIVYMSKIFTFTKDDENFYRTSETIRGGTGYDIHKKLPQEIDDLQPDYSLFGIKDVSYGFITRGCPNKCPWCIVPHKEGKPAPYRDIEEILNGNNKAVLMDNNILATDYGIAQLEKIAELQCRVDFNQGIDARLITEDIAKILGRIKWIDYIRLACDQKSQIPHILKAHDMLVKYGYPQNKVVFCYTLINDFDDTMYRLDTMRKHKWFYPGCQPYRDFNNPKQRIPQWQKDLARWANRGALYRSTEFKDYEPRKGFKCQTYFDKPEGILF